MLPQEGAQGVEAIATHGEAGRHRMAAAGDQQAGASRLADRRSQVEARHRSAGRLADVAVDRDDADRPVAALAQPSRDDAQHPRVPAVAGDDDDRIGRAVVYLGACGRQHRRLDGLAILVVGVEHRGDARCLRRVIGGQQSGAQIRSADPPAGVDPRPQDEANVIGVEGAVQRAALCEGHKARIAAGVQNLQALCHEGAVQTGQRHDVADSGQHHEIEQAQQIRFRRSAIVAALP